MSENIIDKEVEQAKKEADHFGLQYISLRGMNIPFDILSIIPEDIARKNQVIVYKRDGKHIDIAIADPKKLQQKAPQILTDLKKKQGYNFSIAVTTPTDFNYALLGYKQKNDQLKRTVNDGKSNNATNVMTNQIISLKDKEIPYSTLTKFPRNIAEKYRIIIFEEDKDGKSVKVALEDPDNLQTQEILDFIGSRNGIKIKQFRTTPEDVDWALKLYDKKPQENEKNSENISQSTRSDAVNKNLNEDKQIKPKELKKQDISPEIFHKPTLEPVNEIANVGNSIKPNIKSNMQLKDDTKPKEIEKQDVIGKGEPRHEAKSEEVTVSEINSNASNEIKSVPEKDEMTITASSDEEQNLDKLLPNGVNDVNALAQIVQSGSIPRIVAAIIYLGTKLEASDIHLEADAKNLYLRYRIDGILKEILKMPLSLQAPIVSRIKILTKLKIDEQRIPQDGRFDVIVLGKEIDLRVSTLPTIHGEKIVMRLLDKTTGVISLDKLGLVGVNLKRVQEAIDKPYGIIFVTGPTGSGKTTTLYAILNKLNTSEVNIVTLEDPVEYELPGINQCQIKPKIGFGFADGLRSILRQDPNIIMVGEVRDSETANMATHAALTGHLVLSTLHTNDSCGALPRLIDMGVEPYLITSSINAIVAQRLVRKLCDKCKVEVQIPDRLKKEIRDELSQSYDEEIKKIAAGDMKFYRPKGCLACKDGYKGRIGLFEVLSMTDRIEQLAVNRATTSIIKRAAFNQGLVTMRQDGFAKAVRGLTSIDEIIRVTSK